MDGKFHKGHTQRKLDLPLQEISMPSTTSLEEDFCNFKQIHFFCKITNKLKFSNHFINIFLVKLNIFKYQLKKLSLQKLNTLKLCCKKRFL